ncbi:hypothetical protein M0D21_07740 [Aquimarina sp. D1M17]|uniref:MutS-related protein n=1 Tax=Aquimarina acroporae TaxID=2937283 RepID=UPI0020BEA9B8|nr:hypothetical protein [Aquimarina acroporae]MCK8521454.1 hypothetical protein [Aquimarina acroporae]
MNNIQDLHIEKEILPLFDHTLNNFSRSKLLELLYAPLKSKSDIKHRQGILRGFTANRGILSTYSYSVSYLIEVHEFLTNYDISDLSQRKFAYRFLTSKKIKVEHRSRLSQMILLFHRLYSFCFSRLSLQAFPNEYANILREIIDFFAVFNLAHYEELIREYKFGDTEVIELCSKIEELQAKGKIFQFWEHLFCFEAFDSISQTIAHRKFTYPEFGDHIELKGLYHPLLTHPIKNDFKTLSNVVVLNGANMSGKSTFLKAIGLSIYFGHLGIGVPASYARIPFFSNFSIGINHRDDMLNGYSHFMTEVQHLKNVVLTSNTESCFAIFDELFSGTNIEDALEICNITIKGLTKYKDSLFFISTHIQQLKEIDIDGVSSFYIDCELINNTPTFTYVLKEGWSDVKIGSILFEKEGLKELLSI